MWTGLPLRIQLTKHRIFRPSPNPRIAERKLSDIFNTYLLAVFLTKDCLKIELSIACGLVDTFNVSNNEVFCKRFDQMVSYFAHRIPKH